MSSANMGSSAPIALVAAKALLGVTPVLDGVPLPPAFARGGGRPIGSTDSCKRKLSAHQLPEKKKSRNYKRKKCLVCKKVAATFGYAKEAGGDEVARYCVECARDRSRASLGLVLVSNVRKKCEDCIKYRAKRKSVAYYGFPKSIGGTGEVRWCKDCAERHPGAASMRKKCADCEVKLPVFGIPIRHGGDAVARWCAACGKQHANAENVVHRLCEDCGKIRSNFGMPDDKERRWCSKCAKSNHEGAIDLVSKKCEDCQLTIPKFGFPLGHRLAANADRPVRRWCGRCAKRHDGAVSLISRSSKPQSTRPRHDATISTGDDVTVGESVAGS